MPSFKFGRTQFEPPSFLEKLKKMKLKDLKNLRWKDLTPAQRKKVIIGVIVFFVLILMVGMFTQNDEEAYKENVNNFVAKSAQYDVNATAKTTTSSAHQLIIGQADKLKTTKQKNYKTKVNSVESKIATRKGNSIVGTTRVNTTEQMGTEAPKNFTHLFIFQGQKVGASWKISNLLEAEARIQSKDANKSDSK